MLLINMDHVLLYVADDWNLFPCSNIKFFPFLYSSLWSMPNTTRENLCLIKYEIWAKSHFNFLYQYSDYLIQGHFDLLPFLLFYIEYIFRLPSVHLFCMSTLVKYFAQKWKWSDINVQLIWFSIYILRPKKRNVISCLFTVIGPLGGKLVANTKYKWIILAFLSAPSTPENKLKIENWKQSKNFRMKIITFRMTGLWKCGIWKKEFKLQQNLNFCLHKHKTHIICYHQGYI